MASPILITGGTGTLGSLVVPRLRNAGHDVRVLSRGKHDPADGVEYRIGDLTTGEGVADALAGVRTVLHLAGTAKGDEVKMRHLAGAATQAGTGHIVFISVVGADRVPIVSGLDRAMFGYLGQKAAAARVLADSGVPWTTLRATQFHDLVLLMAQQMAKLPVMPVPAGWRMQPIDAGEVDDRLVELALGTPSGRVPDLGGPRVYELSDLMRGYLKAAGKRRPLLPMHTPGKAAKAYRAGANLAPERAVGRRTWDEFLADRLSTPRSAPRLVRNTA
jgi:uncharacterized protein YbjT (DUF2867 family)